MRSSSLRENSAAGKGVGAAAENAILREKFGPEKFDIVSTPDEVLIGSTRGGGLGALAE
jgi:hypothetical protein